MVLGDLTYLKPSYLIDTVLNKSYNFSDNNSFVNKLPIKYYVKNDKRFNLNSKINSHNKTINPESTRIHDNKTINPESTRIHDNKTINPESTRIHDNKINNLEFNPINLVKKNHNSPEIKLVSNYSVNLSSIHHSEHLIIPIIINYKNKIIQTQAMIDSGATSSFIDNNFVKDHNLPLDKKPLSIPLHVIDGCPIVSSEITHNTIPLNLLIINHSEEITLDVT